MKSRIQTRVCSTDASVAAVLSLIWLLFPSAPATAFEPSPARHLHRE